MPSEKVFNRGLAHTIVALVACLILAVLWQVISRYVLAAPAPWTEEIARFLLIWIAMLGGAFAYGRGSHIGLDLLPQKLAGRSATWLMLFIHVVCGVFAVLVLVAGGSQLVAITWTLRQHSAAIGLPIALVYAVIPLSGLLISGFAFIGAKQALTGGGSAHGER